MLQDALALHAKTGDTARTQGLDRLPAARVLRRHVRIPAQQEGRTHRVQRHPGRRPRLSSRQLSRSTQDAADVGSLRMRIPLTVTAALREIPRLRSQDEPRFRRLLALLVASLFWPRDLRRTRCADDFRDATNRRSSRFASSTARPERKAASAPGSSSTGQPAGHQLPRRQQLHRETRAATSCVTWRRMVAKVHCD